MRGQFVNPTQQVLCNGAPEDAEVFDIDARGSRPNALFDYKFDIPVVSPLDDIQAIDGACWREYDYLWKD